MRDLSVFISLATALATGVSGAIAALLWWRADPRPWVWSLLRGGQVVAVIAAGVACVRYFAGPQPTDDLFYLYAVLPVAVAFIAEQLRLATAETILEDRGLENAQAVGKLPEDEQNALVTAILCRELGIVAAGSLVACFLALRAWGVA